MSHTFNVLPVVATNVEDVESDTLGTVLVSVVAHPTKEHNQQWSLNITMNVMHAVNVVHSESEYRRSGYFR